MTPLEIRDTIDARLAAQWSDLSARQDAFFQQRGKFAQALSTHSAPPADGADVVPDRAQDHPPGQPESWNTLGPLPAQMMSALRLDAYHGQSGKGYVLVATVLLEGRPWQRILQRGPEAWRARPWQALPSLSELMPKRQPDPAPIR